MSNLRLSESEVSTLLNALLIAAERFSEHAKELQTSDFGVITNAGYVSLAKQFLRQKNESENLADKIQSAETILLVPEASA